MASPATTRTTPLDRSLTTAALPCGMAVPSSFPSEARALALLSLDALPWAKDWATWRVRFAYDNEQRGISHAEIAAFLREAVAPLCRKRTDCAGTVLYLLDPEDLKPVFRAFAGVAHGRGAILSLQAQHSYREATRIAANGTTAVRAA